MIDTDVVVPLNEFERLVEERKQLFMLLDAIFTNCELSNSGNNLLFYNIEQIMQIIEPYRYKKTVNRLKQDRERMCCSQLESEENE